MDDLQCQRCGQYFDDPQWEQDADVAQVDALEDVVLLAEARVEDAVEDHCIAMSNFDKAWAARQRKVRDDNDD